MRSRVCIGNSQMSGVGCQDLNRCRQGLGDARALAVVPRTVCVASDRAFYSVHDSSILDYALRTKQSSSHAQHSEQVHNVVYTL